MSDPIILHPGNRVRTIRGETGTITTKTAVSFYDWWVLIDNSTDTQVPPRWIGNIEEPYRADQLTLIPPTP